jgi:hypothetical protein
MQVVLEFVKRKIERKKSVKVTPYLPWNLRSLVRLDCKKKKLYIEAALREDFGTLYL